MEKFTYAQKAQQIILLNAEIAQLREIFNTPNDQIASLHITAFYNKPAFKMPNMAFISDVESLKSWINDYMPTLVAKQMQLEHEINQHDNEINS